MRQMCTRTLCEYTFKNYIEIDLECGDGKHLDALKPNKCAMIYAVSSNLSDFKKAKDEKTIPNSVLRNTEFYEADVTCDKFIPMICEKTFLSASVDVIIHSKANYKIVDHLSSWIWAQLKLGGYFICLANLKERKESFIKLLTKNGMELVSSTSTHTCYGKSRNPEPMDLVSQALLREHFICVFQKRVN